MLSFVIMLYPAIKYYFNCTGNYVCNIVPNIAHPERLPFLSRGKQLRNDNYPCWYPRVRTIDWKNPIRTRPPFSIPNNNCPSLRRSENFHSSDSPPWPSSCEIKRPKNQNWIEVENYLIILLYRISLQVSCNKIGNCSRCNYFTQCTRINIYKNSTWIKRKREGQSTRDIWIFQNNILNFASTLDD